MTRFGSGQTPSNETVRRSAFRPTQSAIVVSEARPSGSAFRNEPRPEEAASIAEARECGPQRATTRGSGYDSGRSYEPRPFGPD